MPGKLTTTSQALSKKHCNLQMSQLEFNHKGGKIARMLPFIPVNHPINEDVEDGFCR